MRVVVVLKLGAFCRKHDPARARAAGGSPEIATVGHFRPSAGAQVSLELFYFQNIIVDSETTLFKIERAHRAATWQTARPHQ
jgi:hypothetical protein